VTGLEAFVHGEELLTFDKNEDGEPVLYLGAEQ